MRIIGGELRGRKLFSVKGTKTRPTSDRIREAIFNILSARIRGAVVLDLFAGTGAFGLEALSRGAEFAAFADAEREAMIVLQRNIQACRLEEKTWSVQWDITKNLNCLRAFEPAFSLVFLDPPYNRNLILPSLTNLLASQCLEKGACIVVEHAQNEPIPDNQPLIQLTDQRRYGKTLVSFFAYMV